MIKGFMKLKNVPPGSLFRFEDGGFGFTTEYRTGEKLGYDAYLDSGESCHADEDEWVAIISLEYIENETEGLEYPDSKYTQYTKETQ